MRPRLVNGLPVAPLCGHTWDRIENVGGGLTRCRDCGDEGVDPAASPVDDLKNRLLLRRATRFSFEANTKDGSFFQNEIDAELVPDRYGGGWRVKRGNRVLCRKKTDHSRLEWGHMPYYDIEEVKISDRDQAISMALDIAEDRVAVVEP